MDEVVGRLLQREDDLGQATSAMQAALHHAGGWNAGESSDDSFGPTNQYSRNAAAAGRSARVDRLEDDFRMAGQKALAEADYLLSREVEVAVVEARREAELRAATAHVPPSHHAAFDRQGSGGFEVTQGGSSRPPSQRHVEEWAIQLDNVAKSRMAQAYERRVESTASPQEAISNQSKGTDTQGITWQGLAPTVSNPQALQAAGVDKVQQLQMQKTMSTSSPFVLQQEAPEVHALTQTPWPGPTPTVSNPRALQAAGVDKAQQLQMQKTMSSSSPFVLQQADQSATDNTTDNTTGTYAAPEVVNVDAWTAQLESAHSGLHRSSSAHERAIGAKLQQRIMQKTMSNSSRLCLEEPEPEEEATGEEDYRYGGGGSGGAAEAARSAGRSGGGDGGQLGGLLSTVSNPRALQAAGVDKTAQLRMQKTMCIKSPFVLQQDADDGSRDGAHGSRVGIGDLDGSIMQEQLEAQQAHRLAMGGGHSPLPPTISKPTMSQQLRMQQTMSNASPFVLQQEDDATAIPGSSSGRAVAPDVSPITKQPSRGAFSLESPAGAGFVATEDIGNSERAAASAPFAIGSPVSFL